MSRVTKNYYRNGRIRQEYWMSGGQFHKEDEPAIIDYYPNGTIMRLIFYKNNKLS